MRSERRCVFHLVILLALVGAVAGLAPTRALAQCDTAPPELTNFAFTPTAVNTSSASQVVTCDMTFTDAPAGVFGATCSFQFIDFFTGVVQVQTCAAITGVGGVYTCDVTLPRYAAQGTWKASVAAFDVVGNQRAWTEFDLLIAGFPTSLTVASDPDVVAPDVSALAFTPNAIDVSSGARTVTCTMTFTDAKAGVETARCFFGAPDASSGQASGCGSSTLKSGTRQNGVFECVLSIPRYADAGTWKASVSAADATGNNSAFDETLLAQRGLPVDLSVASNPEDVDPPMQMSFDFNPKTADAGAGPTAITCEFGYVDNPAGLQGASCDFNFTDAMVFPPVSQSIGCTGSVPTSGTPQNGTTRCVVTLPRYSAPGSWSVSVGYRDAVGNGTSAPHATPLAVTCGGEVEATLRFATPSTLTWTPVIGATRYNVYRGDVSNVAVDYGACQNARDPDLLDTLFNDPDVPAPAGRGFQYLVSYETASGSEAGLGRASDGSARSVAAPCP